MKKNENGFSLGLVLLLIFIVGAIAAASVLVLKNMDKHPSETSQQTGDRNQNKQTEQTKSTIQSMDLVTAPMVTVNYDSSWSRLKEFTYDRDGLFKTIDGVKFLITFTRTPLKYDYMDRDAGGAYPPGKLYKEITANGKHYYIGKITEPAVAGAFLSTCPLTSNGACSLHLPDNYGYMIVDLHRFAPTNSNYKATSPLDLSSTTDQKAIDEFVDIMSTLKF